MPQVSDPQFEEERFPDHSSCSFVSSGKLGNLGWGAGEDMRAMAARAEVARQTLAMIPRRRSVARPARAQRGTVPAATGLAGCGGIDDCVERKARAAGIPLAELTTDGEFLRRVRLDLTGRIPTREEVLRFLADRSADKRSQLVDSLLARPEWADRWALFFGDLFRNTKHAAGGNRWHGRDALHLYFRNSLRANKPYDRMAREMLAAEGTHDGREYPASYSGREQYQSIYRDLQSYPVRASPVPYVAGGRTPGGPAQDTYDTLASITARDFLGISAMDCVLCHDGEGRLEGVNAWGARASRLEAWGLAAFFSDLPSIERWRPKVKIGGRHYLVLATKASMSLYSKRLRAIDAGED